MTFVAPTSQAREAILKESQAVEARRAARVRQLAMNPPQVYKLDWSSFEPFPHRFRVYDDAQSPTYFPLSHKFVPFWALSR